MKRITGIFLLSLHLLAFTECHQLLRIPFLVQHFGQHCATDPEMNFNRFIRIHYLSPFSVTNDFSQDQKLPFRNVDCHLLNGTVYIFEGVPISIVPAEELSAVFFSYNETNKPQFSHFDIFQPPKAIFNS